MPFACFTRVAILFLASLASVGTDKAFSSGFDNAANLRLIGGEATAEIWQAGLEIRLEPGWKTYWRTPGESGVAPVFDWAHSENVANIHVRWPAPQRFEDSEGVSIGYKSDVILPLDVIPKLKDQPAKISLSLNYAICRDVCVPVKGTAEVTLQPGRSPDSDATARIDAARKQVPAVVSLADLPLRLQWDAAASPPTLTFLSQSAGEDVLVEGPENWYLSQPEQTASSQVSGLSMHVLRLSDLPKGETISGQKLMITLIRPNAPALESEYVIP